jgi:hypothetical protein
MSGRVSWNSLSTTVSTPPKKPGRYSPSSSRPTGPESTVTCGSEGYISRRGGAKTTLTPSSAQISRSRSMVRGYRSKSSPAPNWSGLTKIETSTLPPGPSPP